MTKMIPNRQIAEEAADWAVRIDSNSLDDADRDLLAHWLRASPAHVDELLFSSSILSGLGRIDASRRLEIEEFLQDGASEVIPLFDCPEWQDAGSGTVVQRAQPDPPLAPVRRSTPLRWAALAASLVLLVLAGFVLNRPNLAGSVSADAASEPPFKFYATDLGEQRSITLADGSIVFLNTNSSVRVSLSSGERRIDLLEGEALFEVAHDQFRPFRVYAAGTVTQAVGTKFNVKHTPGGVSVVVVEGKVLVDNRAANARPRRFAAGNSDEPDGLLAADQAVLLAGQQAQLSLAARAPLVDDADIVKATSWRMRQLSFDNAGLAEIAAEFNRYNRTAIVLADSSLHQTRLSGVFDANDSSSFIAFLELSAAVQVDRSQPGRIVLKAKGR